MNSTASWSLLKKLKFSVIAILFLFIFIEILFRLYFFIAIKPFGTSVKIQGSALQVEDSNLVFKNTPFYIDYNKKYQHDENGFKCKLGEIKPSQKTKNTFVVLLLGASSMEGMGSNKNGDWYDITGVSDHGADETIAAYLQNYLQEKMPLKKVLVYNGATSSYVLWQSLQKYILFKDLFKPDFVISMDGNNEFASLNKNFDKKKLIQKEFNNFPIFKFPVNNIISITQYCYFLNSLKKFLYDIKVKIRTTKNENKNYSIKKKWLNTKANKLLYAPYDSSIHRAVENYITELSLFDSILIKNKTPHLLVYQPYLFLKSKEQQSETEKALYNYFTHFNNNAIDNTYKKKVILKVGLLEKKFQDIKLLNPNEIPVKNLFVDYCHYTTEGNKWFASYFGDVIIEKINP